LLSVVEPPRLGLQIDLDLFPALLIISLIVISRLTRDHLRAFDSCHRCWMDNNALYFPSTHSNTRMCKTFRKLAKGFLHGAPKVHQRCLLLRELRSGLLHIEQPLFTRDESIRRLLFAPRLCGSHDQIYATQTFYSIAYYVYDEHCTMLQNIISHLRVGEAPISGRAQDTTQTMEERQKWRLQNCKH
jgi:hypothetical protein